MQTTELCVCTAGDHGMSVGHVERSIRRRNWSIDTV